MVQHVIMSLKGWDGTRILGVFDSMSSAEIARDEFLKTKGPKTKAQENLYFPEEFFFDVVNVNMISIASEQLASCSRESVDNTIIRNHIYNV